MFTTKPLFSIFWVDHLLFKNMKTIDLFCASPASTTVCSSIDQRAMVRRGTRPIDRNTRRTRAQVPCSSQLAIDPKPYYHSSKSTSANQSQLVGRKSSDDINDGLISPGGSSRFLLSDKPFIDLLLDSSSDQNNTVSALVSTKPVIPISKTSPTISSPLIRDQVVELRVSIHCKGCEGKVKKHISRMEGVTSFSIDLATKKVTVIGNVTPLGVLTSVSRVKSAQFWLCSSSSSSSSSPMAGLAQSMKDSQKHY